MSDENQMALQISDLTETCRELRAKLEAAERELTAFTGFNLATYQKTCVHHTDEERGAFQCPVCAGKARDSALATVKDLQAKVLAKENIIDDAVAHARDSALARLVELEKERNTAADVVKTLTGICEGYEERLRVAEPGASRKGRMKTKERIAELEERVRALEAELRYYMDIAALYRGNLGDVRANTILSQLPMRRKRRQDDEPMNDWTEALIKFGK